MLAFLSAMPATPVAASMLIRRAALLEVDAPAIRMALARLAREGVIEQVERGIYAVGGRGAALDRIARGWREAEARVRPWDGRWLVASIAHLGRADRAGVRGRERALSLTGFVRAADGNWIRPDNLAAPFEEVAARLQMLGLEEDATLLAGATVLPRDDAAFRSLWPVRELEAGYRFWIKEMTSSEARVSDTRDNEATAREMLLLGQAVIRAINRDPLLPGEMIDVDLRARMVDAMRRYDEAGKRCWAVIA